MNDRQMKLLAVQQAGFVMYDTALFLDTHPGCSQALEHFQRARTDYQQAKAEYETAYGPLTLSSAGTNGSWSWISEPMPWEREA